MIKVYIASKLKNAKHFQELRREWRSHGIDLHARWFNQAHIEQTTEPTPEEFHIFWLVDEEDVLDSDAVIVYGQKGDILRGALVEAGLAIGAKKLVILVGDNDFGTWRHHPQVVEADNLNFARELILRRFRVHS